MDQNWLIKEMTAGYNTAFIDYRTNSNLAYRPELVINDRSKGKKVLVTIEEELKNCDAFKISVAFITMGGITPLLQILKELEAKNIQGEILTTDYLFFSEPDALDKLSSLKNITLKMYHCAEESGGFHTKGYIFKQDEIYRIIIGSANMTLSAVTCNKEWNTKIVSSSDGEMAQDILNEFENLWTDSHSIAYEACCDHYRLQYLKGKMIRQQHQQALKEKVISLPTYTLVPNKMQVAFVSNIMALIEQSANKALLLSATGTGKTFASAFAMREIEPKRLLFLVHREQIAKQALKSYQRVFGSSKTYGLLSGSAKEIDADFLFSTMQMMSKEDIHSRFDVDSFDVIILDECHHAGAESYQRIMSYFKPQFWLGMTASPDTPQYDIYSIFDHHIAYEIRLQQALEEDLLCPFHYFGITDLEINGEVFDDQAGIKQFDNLVCEDRVRYIINQAEYFGYCGERVKGLIFCSRKDEAKILSERFNAHGYRTAVLTGEDSQAKREEMINQLVDDFHPEKQLDYIFTIDIFNEGVDIPEINQVIMLRPTQSPVVFVQQLGRGLRKTEDKEYVVILDFIGNYMNNFMIPIALSGDRSYNKDGMRRYVMEGSRVIPGSSTIHFDEISKQRIYASIDKARTNDFKLLRESYQSLKYKLGRIPTIMEFKTYGSVDVHKIFEKCGSYHAFLKKYEEDYHISLSSTEENIIEYLSKKVLSYKRIDEIAILLGLIGNELESIDDFGQFLDNHYGISISDIEVRSIVCNLTNQFPKEIERKKYQDCVLIEEDGSGTYRLSKSFESLLSNLDFKEMVLELLSFGKMDILENYSERYKDTAFVLYQKYNYEDVCRLLGWRKSMNAQNIGGYFYDSETKTLPVFINYDKTDDAIAYEDRFISENQLIALSKHPRKIDSADAMHIYKRGVSDQDNRIFLFIRKNKDDKEAKEFYFLGEMQAEGVPKPVYMKETKDNAFEIFYHLDVPVRSDLYDYMVRS